MKKYDVIVVGAGPSGSTAAKHIADNGKKAVLIDAKKFPRNKTCAGWINSKITDDFPYLRDISSHISATDFYGITFHNTNISKNIQSDISDTPAGHLINRVEFDNYLKDLAIEANAEFIEGEKVVDVVAKDNGGEVTLESGQKLQSRVVVGADGVSSSVGKKTGLNIGAEAKSLIYCANEDFELSPETIEQYFSGKKTIHVCLGYSFISGYAWVFPKEDRLTIGVGARGAQNIGIYFTKLLEELKKNKIIPQDISAKDTQFATEPAGVLFRLEQFANDYCLLVGDALGAVSGSTGEGIYPGMISALVAAQIIVEGLDNGTIEKRLLSYKETILARLEKYLQPPTKNILLLLPLLCSNQKIANKFARSFLFGEKI